MVILETRDLKKQYGTGETAVHALAGVNLSVENGEFVAVVGTSGSGKSTLLHMLGGLDRATSGKVYVDGKDIFALKDEELTIFRRRKIGFVFQSFNLVPVLSVYENIVLPLQLDGKTVDNAFIGDIAEALGLKEKLNVLPNQLSGGQQQRVAIARALAAKPAILLADEPTGNLDSRTSQDVMGLLKTTSTKFAQTIVMITHNEEIAQLADRIIRIEDGRIVTGKAGEASLPRRTGRQPGCETCSIPTLVRQGIETHGPSAYPIPMPRKKRWRAVRLRNHRIAIVHVALEITRLVLFPCQRLFLLQKLLNHPVCRFLEHSFLLSLFFRLLIPFRN